MSFAQFSPDFDVYESGSIGDPLDTNAITGNMTAIIARVATGTPAAGLDQRIKHSDSLETATFEDHPATITFNGNSAVVTLTRAATKRYLRLVTATTEPTDDPLFVAGGVLIW